MQRFAFISAIIAAVVLNPTIFAAGPEHDHGQTAAKDEAHSGGPECPVMGEAVDFSLSVSTDDGPVYFCCAKCVGKFEKDPAKYAEYVSAQRKALDAQPRVQVTCPISGKPVDDKMSTDHKGQKVFFCCKLCPAKYKSDPAKHAARLAGSYTYQTKCPVSEKPIDPTAFTTLEGGFNVYFCCDGCIEKFTAEPAKYQANLESQGVIAALDHLTAGKKGDHADDHGHGDPDH